MKSLKKPLIYAGLAALIYFLFFRKTENLASSGSTTIVDPLNILRTPPPGYSGPVNGPFTWAGIGLPPGGKYTVLGNPVT